MYAKTMVAALLGAAEAGRIPIHRNNLTVADYEYQKNIVNRYVARDIYGDDLPVIDYMNTQYFIEIQVGSEDKSFKVVPDTGSSNLWVYSANCSTLVCTTHQQYDSSKSSTYVADG